MNSLITEEKVTNKNLIKKNVIIFILVVWSIVITFLFVFLSGYNKAKKKYTKDFHNMEMSKEFLKYSLSSAKAAIFQDNFSNPYFGNTALKNNEIRFMNEDMSSFIITCSRSFGLDPDFCMSILNQENPELNKYAKGRKNKNKTRDLGLWQINSDNLSEFSDSEYCFDKIYWEFDDIKFDVYNWKHNTWIALKFIEELHNYFGDYEKVARAYNGGYNVANKTTGDPAKYAKSVMETYIKLKEV